MSFDSLGLAPELLRAVAREGYSEPTPVQAEAIPYVLTRRDVLAGAQTGTGKTAAFVLPILQLLHENRPTPRHPIRETHTRRRSFAGRPQIASGLPIRCLVLTPTRELALQVDEFVKNYGRERPVRSAVIYGGVGYEQQFQAIKAGPEIVVATPGRLIDIQEQGKIDLRSVEILVLDEADRMLDMGFIRDIRRIIALLPPRRQNLLFSATFSDDVRSLAATFMRDAAQVQVARRNAPIELVRQVVYPVDRQRKRELLSHLIRTGRIDRALVFTRTKHGANRLAEQLAYDGIDAVAIHGNKSQGQRIRALDDFKEGRAAILVATEVAARGLDIDGLPHVVNYELPTVAQDYIHRIGRTGRAGMEGDAVSLVCIDERDLLEEIERLLRGPIPWEVVPGFEPDRRLLAEPIPELTRGGRSSGARPRRSPNRRTQPRPQVRAEGSWGRPARGPRPTTTAAPTHRPARPAAPVQPGVPRPFVALPGERFSRPSAS
jgi:ATP-dependent RNA helicase RhlE